ncbi:hypothetical protein D9M70_394490 [compost metagenome]
MSMTNDSSVRRSALPSARSRRGTRQLPWPVSVASGCSIFSWSRVQTGSVPLVPVCALTSSLPKSWPRSMNCSATRSMAGSSSMLLARASTTFCSSLASGTFRRDSRSCSAPVAPAPAPAAAGCHCTAPAIWRDSILAFQPSAARVASSATSSSVRPMPWSALARSAMRPGRKGEGRVPSPEAAGPAKAARQASMSSRSNVAAALTPGVGAGAACCTPMPPATTSMPLPPFWSRRNR